MPSLDDVYRKFDEAVLTGRRLGGDSLWRPTVLLERGHVGRTSKRAASYGGRPLASVRPAIVRAEPIGRVEAFFYTCSK